MIRVVDVCANCGLDRVQVPRRVTSIRARSRREALQELSEKHIDITNDGGRVGLHLHASALASYGKFSQHTAEQAC